MRQHHLRRHSILAILTFTAAMATQVAVGQQIKFDPSLERNPPRVARAEFELLAKPVAVGNAILRVQFADQRRGTRIAIQGGPGPTYLRDDGTYPDAKIGDGQYSAIVNINTDAYLSEQRRRLDLAKRYPTLPRFHMRELIGDEPFQPLQLRPMQPGTKHEVDRFRGVPFDVTPWKELTITHTSVVEDPERTFDVCTGRGDPRGAWTFGKLMTEMANEPETKIRPGDFVEHWLAQWTTDLTINTFNAPNRQVRTQRIIDHWPRLDDGQLDLAQAPFRLLAIVNRQDLRGNAMFGSGDAGEVRFVFGMLDCDGVVRPGPDELEVLVILEYGIRKNTCWDIKNWAQEWRELGTHWIGSPAYNAQLQSITDQFTLANANPSQLPNRSAIKQVRTNEFELHESGGETFWQLRESRLNSCKTASTCGSHPGRLTHKTVAQTPDGSFLLAPAGRASVRDFINANEARILAGTHVVPLTLPDGRHFLGGAADVGGGRVWDVGSENLEARHIFSLATCNACHSLETGTDFVHVSTRAAGEESRLSGFLTGSRMPSSDPVSHVPRTFHELLDRQQKLDAAASMSCFGPADFPIEELFHEFVPPAFAH